MRISDWSSDVCSSDLINSVVSLVYYLRVIAPAYFEPLVAPIPVLGQWAYGATLFSAVAVIALGLLAGPFIDAFLRADLLPGGAEHPDRVSAHPGSRQEALTLEAVRRPARGSGSTPRIAPAPPS